MSRAPYRAASGLPSVPRAGWLALLVTGCVLTCREVGARVPEVGPWLWEALQTEQASPSLVGGLLLVMVAAYQLAMVPTRRRTKDYHDNTSARYKALRAAAFPPGFPNGWHAVCNTTDLEGGRVKSISALGTHMVAFRGETGAVGVLDAFCPHMGAHLGTGGKVVGDSLRCPFHGWSFDAAGKCVTIPYAAGKCVPDRSHTKAYEVREVLDRVFVWFHAEGLPPQWELECHRDVEKDLDAGQMYLATVRTLEFDMHSCEMHMNSADPHHFNTMHAPLPLPLLDQMITAYHSITQDYGSGEVDGEIVQKPELSTVVERTRQLFLFGQRWLPVPLSAWAAAKVEARITFEGPTIVHFTIKTPFGKLRQVKTLLPVEPFKQFVESRLYAEWTVPRPLACFFSMIAWGALEQDRSVWENKMYRTKPTWVSGDGPFPAFIRWYGQFYSESSDELSKKSLDW